jgi:hypothetical protein
MYITVCQNNILIINQFTNLNNNKGKKVLGTMYSPPFRGAATLYTHLFNIQIYNLLK